MVPILNIVKVIWLLAAVDVAGAADLTGRWLYGGIGLADESGNGNNLKRTNMIARLDHFSGESTLTGDGCLSTGASPPLRQDTFLTLWVRPVALTRKQALVTWSSLPSNTVNGLYIDKYLRLCYIETRGANEVSRIITAALPLSPWTHVLLILTGTKVQLTINGARSWSNTVNYFTNTDFGIGCAVTTSGYSDSLALGTFVSRVSTYYGAVPCSTTRFAEDRCWGITSSAVAYDPDSCQTLGTDYSLPIIDTPWLDQFAGQTSSEKIWVGLTTNSSRTVAHDRLSWEWYDGTPYTYHAIWCGDSVHTVADYPAYGTTCTTLPQPDLLTQDCALYDSFHGGGVFDRGCSTNVKSLCVGNFLPFTLVPATDAPDTPFPDTGPPDTPFPDTNAPPTPFPGTNAPDTPFPDTGVPSTPFPDTPFPNTNAPTTPFPDTGVPSTPFPGTPFPDTNAPTTPFPDTDVPHTDIPDTIVPDTPFPDTKPPPTPSPLTAAPETRVPDTNAPLTPFPGTAAPTTPFPDTGAPPTPGPLTPVPDTLAPLTPFPGTLAPPTPSPNTLMPTAVPTHTPSTASPTEPPNTAVPTAVPPVPPTAVPTAIPSPAPNTSAPTAFPTRAPSTAVPTSAPTAAPNASSPTALPSSSPDTLLPETRAPATEVPQTPPPVRTPTPGKSIPKAEKDTAQNAASGASAVNPGGAKLAAVIGMDCEVEDIDLGGGEPLDWEFHPIGIGIGDHAQKYFLGAVVFNLGIVVVFLFVNYAIAWVQVACLKVPLATAIFYVRAPGLVYIPMVWLLMGTSIAASNLTFFPSRAPGWVAIIGTVVLALCVSFPFIMWLVLLRKARFQATTVPDPKINADAAAVVSGFEKDGEDDNKQATVYTGWKRTAYILVYGSEVWVRKDGAPDYFVEQYGLFFEQYRNNFHWFSLVEMVQILALALSSAWKPHNHGTCMFRNVLITIVLFLFFMAIVTLRPYNSPLDMVTATAMSGLMFVAVLLMAIAIGVGGNAIMMKWAAHLLLLTALLMMFKGIYDIILYFLDVKIERRWSAYAASRKGCVSDWKNNKAQEVQMVTVCSSDGLTAVLNTPLSVATVPPILVRQDSDRQGLMSTYRPPGMPAYQSDLDLAALTHFAERTITSPPPHVRRGRNPLTRI